MKYATLGVIVPLVSALIFSVPALAADAIVNSIKFVSIPSGAYIEVRSFDDSDANMALKADFSNALAGAGYKPDDEGALIFNFETRDEIGAWSTTDRRHILSLETRGGKGGNESNEARVNVFNSQSGGLLNKGSGGTSIATPSNYRIDVSVEDRKTGKTLWQGWVIADLRGSDGLTLTRKMVPAIISKVGMTARQEAIPLH